MSTPFLDKVDRIKAVLDSNPIATLRFIENALYLYTEGFVEPQSADLWLIDALNHAKVGS